MSTVLSKALAATAAMANMANDRAERESTLVLARNSAERHTQRTQDAADHKAALQQLHERQRVLAEREQAVAAQQQQLAQQQQQQDKRAAELEQ